MTIPTRDALRAFVGALLALVLGMLVWCALWYWLVG
jgi:hypothetical protein